MEIKEILSNANVKIDNRDIYCGDCQGKLSLPLLYVETASRFYHIDEDLNFHFKNAIREVVAIFCPRCGSKLFDYEEEIVQKIIEFLKGGVK